MSVVKAFYHDGMVEFIENPSQHKATNVLVVFPDRGSEIRKFRGALKPSKPIDYSQIATDLHELSHQSEAHIAEELNQDSGNDE